MSIKRSMAALLVIAGLAYTAGHFNVLTGGEARTWAGPKEQEQEPGQELDPETQAFMELAAPSEHHRRLEPLAGEFEGQFKIWFEPESESMDSWGAIKRKWVLGGRFLKETVDAKSFMGTFEAVAYLGYNKMDGQYEFVWLESMSTAMYFETGYFDRESKILRTRGSHRNPITGQVISTRGTLDLSDPNRHVYVGYSVGPDGREYKSFEGIAERK